MNISTYLSRNRERVIDIEEQDRVLDWTLVERGVDSSCGRHLDGVVSLVTETRYSRVPSNKSPN
jgi:hypothetical protein